MRERGAAYLERPKCIGRQIDGLESREAVQAVANAADLVASRPQFTEQRAARDAGQAREPVVVHVKVGEAGEMLDAREARQQVAVKAEAPEAEACLDTLDTLKAAFNERQVLEAEAAQARHATKLGRLHNT